MKINTGASSSKRKLFYSIPVPQGAARAAGSDLRVLKTDLHISNKVRPSAHQRLPRCPGASAGCRHGTVRLWGTHRSHLRQSAAPPDLSCPSASWWWYPPQRWCCVSSLHGREGSLAAPRGGVGTTHCGPFVQNLRLLHLKCRRKQEKRDLN